MVKGAAKDPSPTGVDVPFPSSRENVSPPPLIVINEAPEYAKQL